MSERESLLYHFSLDEVKDVNSYFAKGKMRIAYHGRNPNGTNISKEAFDLCIPTIFNCPVVANYMREADMIGGHDVNIVKTENGLLMQNITEPVGVIPESANTWWETVEEPDGEKHEYLCADVLIWKRQAVYEHLKENGITSGSMEIAVTQRHYDVNGEMHIDAFEFTAFCLLERDHPCFQSAGVELFSVDACREQFSLMMEDFRKEFSEVIAASADDIQNSLKGGDCNMNDCVNIDEMLTQYGLSAEEITFETDGLTQDELSLKFSQLRDEKMNPPEQEPEQPAEPEQKEEPEVQKFSLTVEQFIMAVHTALDADRVPDPYCGGTMRRYWYTECDMEAGLIYVEDMHNHFLYAIPYTMDGDNPVLDMQARKRVKRQYVDFDEGNGGDNDAFVFSCLDAFGQSCKEKFDELTQEKNELEKFRLDTEKARRAEEVQRVFAAFSDLAGNERFDALRENPGDMTADELEEKCFAIRGRMALQQYSLADHQDSVRLPVEDKNAPASTEPYGGIFAEFGIGQ